FLHGTYHFVILIAYAMTSAEVAASFVDARKRMSWCSELCAMLNPAGAAPLPHGQSILTHGSEAIVASQRVRAVQDRFGSFFPVRTACAIGLNLPERQGVTFAVGRET